MFGEFGQSRGLPEKHMDSRSILCATDQKQGQKGTPKNLFHKDVAELSGELSVTICLKTLVLLGNALESFRKFFGAARSMFWLCGSFLALDKKHRRKNTHVNSNAFNFNSDTKIGGMMASFLIFLTFRLLFHVYHL